MMNSTTMTMTNIMVNATTATTTMLFNNNIIINNNNNNENDDDRYDDDEPWMFEEEETTTITPGPWLFYVTMGIAMSMVGILLPLAVCCRYYGCPKNRHTLVPTNDDDDDDDEKNPQDDVNATTTTTVNTTMVVEGFCDEDDSSSSTTMTTNNNNNNNHNNLSLWSSIFAWDHGSRRIVAYTVPFTCTSVSEALCNSTVLGLLGYYVGTEALTAYALLELLLEILQSLLVGPMEGLPTVAAQAVGAKNLTLAGQYVQLSMMLYILVGIPLFVVFGTFTSWLLLTLQWASEEVAHHAQQLVVSLIISKALSAMAQAFSELYNVLDAEIMVGIIEVATCFSVVVGMSLLAIGDELTLDRTGYILIGAELWHVLIYICIVPSFCVCGSSNRNNKKKKKKKKKLLPQKLRHGIWNQCSLTNYRAIRNLLKVSIPISISAVLESMEWSVLGIFAASMGTKEVAAWAIIGTVWEILNSLTYGIGDAAEITVARHLGQGRGWQAQLSAYKSLYLGMMGSSLLTMVFFFVIPYIPPCFTPNTILQELIEECLPLLGIGYWVMTLGEIAWYIVGATSRFDIGTMVHLIVSIMVTVPLGASYTYVFNLNLEGLTSAVVVGYTTIGIILSYLLLAATEWNTVAAQAAAANAARAGNNNNNNNNNNNKMLLLLLFDEEDEWDDLPLKIRRAALQLGYNKGMWNRDEEPPKAEWDWNELDQEDQAAATVMGYTQHTWDNNESSSSSSSSSSSNDSDSSDEEDDDDDDEEDVTSSSPTRIVPPKKKKKKRMEEHYDEDASWKDLPIEIQKAALQLGYTKRMWNRDEEPPKNDWDWNELSQEDRQAAMVMGYNSETWDNESDNDIVPNIYYDEDDDWKDLPIEIQKAALQLGYTKRMWNRDEEEPPKCDWDWDELNDDDRRAARIMGYDSERWNAE